MKKILFFLAIILANSSFGQKPDTIIDGIKYSVLAKYSNGKVKDIGQHNFDCDAQIRKHGLFISYSKSGKEIKRRVYSMGSRRNHSIFWLKIGWWGYDKEVLYFFGVPIETRIVCPCFD
jgi:hypothetical protein